MVIFLSSDPTSEKGHEKSEGYEKMAYIGRQFVSELGLFSSIMYTTFVSNYYLY